MNHPARHIVFAGGGTGGHLFPGFAVAEQLFKLHPAVRITFATGRKPLERQWVAAAGFHQLALPAAPPPRSPRGAWRFLADNLSAVLQARRFLRQESVAAVVGLGGYASLPMAWAAARAGVPLVLLEQNVVPGRTTRFLAPRAALTCIAFDETRLLLHAGGPIRACGNPIRSGFTAGGTAGLSSSVSQSSLANSTAGQASSGAPGNSRQRKLLVLGGSGGAQSLNEEAPRATEKLRRELHGWRIVHQTGARDCGATEELYRKLGIAATVAPFLDPIQPVLRDADLVVCRAGGSTLAELAATGAPAVLVPYPHAAGDHQRKNADVLAAAGAARIVDGRELFGPLAEGLAAAIGPLLQSADARRAMSAAMLRLARPDAAWQVATMLLDLLGAGWRDRLRLAG